MPSRGAWQNKRSDILRMVAGFFFGLCALKAASCCLATCAGETASLPRQLFRVG